MTNSKAKRALTNLALLVAMFVAITGQGLLALSQAADSAQQSKSPTLDSAQGRAGPAVPRATGMDGQSWPHRKCQRACRCIDFAPDYRGKQRNRGLATTWARDCSNCELWTRDRAHFLHCNRSRGHYRQQGVHRHYGGRSLGVAERGHFESRTRCSSHPSQTGCPHWQARATRPSVSALLPSSREGLASSWRAQATPMMRLTPTTERGFCARQMAETRGA